MLVRMTRAEHSSSTGAADGYVLQAPIDINLAFSRDADRSLAQEVEAQEQARRTDTYHSKVQWHRSGEAWVSWWDAETGCGYDRYQLVTEHGVRLGGCWSHGSEECWSLSDPFPPPHRQARHHVVGGHWAGCPLTATVAGPPSASPRSSHGNPWATTAAASAPGL